VFGTIYSDGRAGFCLNFSVTGARQLAASYRRFCCCTLVPLRPIPAKAKFSGAASVQTKRVTAFYGAAAPPRTIL
jgi:hypothetical protein